MSHITWFGSHIEVWIDRNQFPANISLVDHNQLRCQPWTLLYHTTLNGWPFILLYSWQGKVQKLYYKWYILYNYSYILALHPLPGQVDIAHHFQGPVPTCWPTSGIAHPGDIGFSGMSMGWALWHDTLKQLGLVVLPSGIGVDKDLEPLLTIWETA